MLVFAVAGLVVYDRALRRHSPWLFAATGVLLGFAAVYKHVGGYVLLAVALHYALTRRDRRAHALLAMTATAVIVAYVVVMAVAFQRHGHNAFLDDSRVQLQRLTGQKESRGSIGGGGAVHALLGPYKVFAVTLVLTGLAALLVAGRAVQALLRRSTARIADLLLFSWAAAGVLAFAALKLKMGHYFMMVELPLLLYLAAEARVPAWAHRTTATAILVMLFTANLAVFASRFVARDDNALAAVASYTDRHLPPDALVLTEESVGSIIRQPYCKLVRAGSCSRVAQYLIIYRSATQSPPDNPALRRLLRTATPLKAFTGFKERITIYRVAG
jgi:4-amino-4-deoxy-L-arabinose transferase-like glycosyltransferase